MKKSKIILIAILFILSSCLTGCWDSTEINHLAFVTALGFDKSSNGITVTAQTLNPRAIAAQKSTNEAPIVAFTEDGKTALEILRRMSTMTPRRLTGTHMQTIVFGEDFAKDGISEVTDFLLRHYQTSPELYFVVAKDTTANYVLSNLTKLESIPSVKINSSLGFSKKVWAATKSTKIIELVNSIVTNGISPVLTGIRITNYDTSNLTVDGLKLTKNDPIQLSGIAVFKKDKLVGWLNEGESKGYDYIINNVPDSVGYIESPETGRITIEVTSTKSNPRMIITNKKPTIIVDIKIVSKIVNVGSNFDVTKEENLNKIVVLCKNKVKSLCESSIAKAKSLKSDIFGFGEVVHRSNSKIWKLMEQNWNNDFLSLPVSINVSFKITGTGSIENSFISEGK